MDTKDSDGTWWTGKRIALVALGAVVVMAAGVVAVDLFAPKATTRVDQALMDGPAAGAGTGSDYVAVKAGSFQGADRVHEVSGTVTVYEGPDGPFLRFEDYEATSGPDVYIYLSASTDGSYHAGDRLKVLVPGGAEDGQATLRGSFNVPLPVDLEAAAWNSVIVWCDDFGVKFGSAALDEL